MKNFIILIALSITIYSCGTGNMNNNSNTGGSSNDTIRIANESLEYEILIIEPGFESWLVTQP